MKRQYLRTSDITRAVGVHPNTVRLYEAWGFLPPIPRAPNGYRMFTEAHLDQMRLARLAMRCTWLGGSIRQTALSLIRQAAAGELEGALELGYRVDAMVKTERERAEEAVEVLERWAQVRSQQADIRPLRIGQTAELLGVTTDMLRNWEHNRLVVVPRDERNRYRLYGIAEINRLRVIRVLRRARYSTMSILRMLRRLDRGEDLDLRAALDTPGPDEDAHYVTDRWLSTLAEIEQATEAMISHLQEMIAKR